VNLFDNMAILGYKDIMNISEALRKAITESGRSYNELSIAADTGRAQLGRFMSNKRGLNLTTADQLVEALELDVRLVQRKAARHG